MVIHKRQSQEEWRRQAEVDTCGHGEGVKQKWTHVGMGKGSSRSGHMWAWGRGQAEVDTCGHGEGVKQKWTHVGMGKGSSRSGHMWAWGRGQAEMDTCGHGEGVKQKWTHVGMVKGSSRSGHMWAWGRGQAEVDTCGLNFKHFFKRVINKSLQFNFKFEQRNSKSFRIKYPQSCEKLTT